MTDWTKPEPPPVKTGSAEVWPLVLYDISTHVYGSPTLFDACRQRHEFGIRKHKAALEVFNGRDPLNDLRDEALDAVAYSRQQYERTKAAEDWDLHLDCVRLAARVIERIVHASAA